LKSTIRAHFSKSIRRHLNIYSEKGPLSLATWQHFPFAIQSEGHETTPKREIQPLTLVQRTFKSKLTTINICASRNQGKIA